MSSLFDCTYGLTALQPIAIFAMQHGLMVIDGRKNLGQINDHHPMLGSRPKVKVTPTRPT